MKLINNVCIILEYIYMFILYIINMKYFFIEINLCILINYIKNILNMKN